MIKGNCVTCGGPCDRATLCCSDDCERERKRRYNQDYEAANRADRHDYYRRYHAANSVARNERQRAYAKQRRADPVIAARITAEARARRQALSKEKRSTQNLAKKVAKEWRVDVRTALSWIEQGSFPP